MMTSSRNAISIAALAAIAPAALTLAGGCGGVTKRSKTLIEEVRGYNDGVRWRRAPQAAGRITPAERGDFLDERAELEEELRIAQYEIKRVERREGHRAVVHVEWTWHLDSRGIVHETTTRQEWEQHGKRWLMVEERRVRGEPMPGVAEPPEEKGREQARGAPFAMP